MAAEHGAARGVGDPTFRHLRVAHREVHAARLQVEEGLRVDLLNRPLLGRAGVKRAQPGRADSDDHQHDDEHGVDRDVSSVLEDAGFFVASHAEQYGMRPRFPLKGGKNGQLCDW